MTNFTEADHPRAAAGTFTTKLQSLPEASVNLDAWEPGENVDDDSAVQAELAAYRALTAQATLPYTTLAEIDDELDGLGHTQQNTAAREFDLAANALELIVKQDFPTAARLEVFNLGEDDGEVWYVAWAIKDAEGNTLWSADDENAEKQNYSDELASHTPVLDRRGDDYLVQDREGDTWLGIRFN